MLLLLVHLDYFHSLSDDFCVTGHLVSPFVCPSVQVTYYFVIKFHTQYSGFDFHLLVLKSHIYIYWLIFCFSVRSHRGQKQPRNAVFAQALRTDRQTLL